MPTPNIPQVQTANTFDFWRIQTNNLINAANELRQTTYEKEGGQLFLSNTIVDTALLVSGNVRINRLLTTLNANVTNNLTASNVNITGNLIVTTANVTGNLIATNITARNNLSAANLSVTNNISAGNASISGSLSVGGTNVLTSISNAANTVMVSVNGTGALAKKKLNFVDSATVTFSVVAGAGDDADITLTAAGGGGGVGGAQGPQGAQGRQGSVGAQGTAGSPGAQGSAGSPGAQGSAGSPGAQGSAGSPGAQGSTGSPGAQGRQGAQGATGPSTAVNATNDTSNNPLYPVLVGAAGSDQTPKVSVGRLSFNANDGTLTALKFVGDGTGITGITGTPGAQGSAGSPGAQGASGSPSGLSTDLTVRSLGAGTPASGTSGEIRATNDITAYYSSDVRLKENIRKIENALELISMIEGVRYDWTDEYIEKRGGIDDYFVRKEDIGVIAQDLQKVLPEVVAERPDGYLAVRYEKIVALLLAALKELKKEVDDIKKRL